MSAQCVAHQEQEASHLSRAAKLLLRTCMLCAAPMRQPGQERGLAGGGMLCEVGFVS